MSELPARPITNPSTAIRDRVQHMFRALKAETESEGASFESLEFLKHISTSFSIPMFLKIGGVEARNDLQFATEQSISGVIAPMVESGFGVRKFHEATSGRGFEWRAITLESITAVRNVDEILEVALDSGINGVTVGRGDLADSMGLRGREQDVEVSDAVSVVATKASSAGFPVTIGGNITLAALRFLESRPYHFDYVETRRFVFGQPNSAGSQHSALSELGTAAILQEIEVEKEMIDRGLGDVEKRHARIGALTSRIRE